jgi:tRNA (guanine37-N1)-methyltransferase
MWACTDSRLSSVWLERPAVDSMAVTGRSPVQIREAGLFFSKGSIMFIQLSRISNEEMVQKKAPSICVARKDAESIRKYLRERNLLRNDLLLKRNKEYVHFPLRDPPEKELLSYPISTEIFEEKKGRPASYKDVVKVPKELQEALPSSYDIIGDIILLKLPQELRSYRQEIGEALLVVHPSIRTVCQVDPVRGELRTRKVTVIAGEQKTQTVHNEYGLLFNVDVQATYFSPRLASERRRVAGLVRPGETVIDLFAGVAPFSIMIARYAKPRIVYAIDKNREAVELAVKNVKQNHVLETVEVLHGDAQVVVRKIKRKADRIIMNLPFSAHQFFSTALSVAANRCIIHYYDILEEEKKQARIDFLTTVAGAHGFYLSDFSIRPMKSYAPREFYIGIDITATKTPT